MPAHVTRTPIAIALLGLMLLLMVASSWNDSTTTDEQAHIPAGYGYVFLQDARLNPEHPPLIKALAALPLAFSRVYFPTNTASWQDDVNGQWEQGRIFLFESGNDADRIMRLTRLPMMLLALGFGWFFWSWARKRFDDRVALLALTFFVFSPTILAHSRFVTTDVAAAFAFFIGIIAFLRFLSDPSPKNIAIAGLAFGVAQLLKFSLILLVPVYGLLLLAWVVSQVHLHWHERIRLFGKLVIKVIGIVVVGVILIWLVYAPVILNYSPERNLADAEYNLRTFRFRTFVDFDLALIQNGFLRPLGQYFLGLFMVLQRAAGGNTQYFLGEVTNVGAPLYFPILYLLKEPLAFHILSLIALAFALGRVGRAQGKSLAKILLWIRDHFIEFSSMAFVAIYWLSSITSPLNIGVRHVLPTFPFIFVLVSREMISWLRSWPRQDVRTWWEWVKRAFDIYIGSIPRYLLVGALILWQAASVIAVFPHVLSYYNELGGGVENGYLVAVDSNYDWGQDLKRLADFVGQNNIQNIRVDYFGGSSPAYYLGEKFNPWHSSSGYPPDGGWFAISATFQMGGYGTTVKGFERRSEDDYEWLKPFRPVARAGKSIFIYQLPLPNSAQP